MVEVGGLKWGSEAAISVVGDGGDGLVLLVSDARLMRVADMAGNEWVTVTQREVVLRASSEESGYASTSRRLTATAQGETRLW